MSAYTTLIPPDVLHEHLSDPAWMIADCRFSLTDPAAGQLNYLEAHIPGSIYTDLEKDLSAPVISGQTGRHPLPHVAVVAGKFSNWGIHSGIQVIAYDDTAGSIASRLWWMLRWLGHDAVAVLDGGWQGWVSRGYPTRGGEETREPESFSPNIRPELTASAGEILAHLDDPAWQLVDAREAARFRGEIEPIDPVAGRIPSAVNLPHQEVIDPEGNFLPPESLKSLFLRRVGKLPAENTIFYCGSGVTAARGLLALAHGGLGDGRLYPGSWSEWITDPNRPIGRG